MKAIYARDLKPGSVIYAKGRKFAIIDTQRTGENRIELTWHPLGQPVQNHVPVSVAPDTYYLDAEYVIEESPL